MIYNFKLKNGIRCIFNKLDGVYSVSAGILVGAGSAFETKDENGISHLIEHMNFKGTTKRSSFAISEDIDNLGAQINAFTSKEFTCFYVKSISEHFGETFEILCDMFVDAVYDKDELDKERGVVIEEINMYEDTPDELCSDILSEAYFGERGYGATVLGPSENIKRFTRDDILNYKKKYYNADNIVVSFAGSADLDTVKELCEKYLGGDFCKGKTEFPVLNNQNYCKNLFCSKDIEQAHIALAFDAVGVDDELGDAYTVITNVLGGGMSSRLFQSVREKLGLAYSTYSYNSFYKTCGYVTVYAGVNLKNYREAFDAVLNEVKLLKKDGITEKEFLRTREQMKSSLVLAQESTSSQMILLGRNLLISDKLFDMQSRLDDINKLTTSKINEVIKDNLDISKLASAVVGKNVEKLL